MGYIAACTLQSNIRLTNGWDFAAFAAVTAYEVSFMFLATIQSA